MTRCEAITVQSTYSEAHRCLKTTNLEKLRGKVLCPHHRKLGKETGRRGR